MSRLNEYCNVTTDLQDVVKDIEKYAYQDVSNDLFEAVSGQIYSTQGQVGYVGALYIDRELQSQADSPADIDGTDIWYYDATDDVLYLHSDAIGNNAISIASAEWGDIQDDAREDASQELENYLYMYNSPLPFRRNSNQEFDRDIVRATAILTCRNIIQAHNPNHELVSLLTGMVYDPVNESGIVWDYTHGVKKFSFEGTRTSFNGLVTPEKVNGTGTIEIVGQGTSDDYNVYEIEITTGGEVGTAEYQLTSNGVVTGTYETTHNYASLGHIGAYVRFSGTFTAGATPDKWKIEYDGRIKKQTDAGIGSINIVH
jgi:hypothetical protein